MILTFTANTTIDLTLVVPNLANNRTIRAKRTVQSMGGKPTDASWILGELGIPSHALGFAGGTTGLKVEEMLQKRGVITDFVWLDNGSDTRINIVIIPEDTGGAITITTSTLQVDQHHVEQLREKFLSALPSASCLVIGGTLPSGLTPQFYVEFIMQARSHGVPVIFDAAQENLRIGLTARPDFIKPNRDELAEFVGRDIADMQDAYHVGQDILRQYGTSAIITFGGDGALAILPDRAYFVPPLRLDVISPSGAGDAVLAGLAASYERRQSIEEGLKLGFAAAAAVCLQLGTADCRKADVERLLAEISLVPYP